MMSKESKLKAKLKQLINDDANPQTLIDAIKRKDAPYIRGAIKWYETKNGKQELLDFLKKALSACYVGDSAPSSSSDGSSSTQ
jgi:hypothetical protein